MEAVHCLFYSVMLLSRLSKLITSLPVPDGVSSVIKIYLTPGWGNPRMGQSHGGASKFMTTSDRASPTEGIVLLT